MAHADTLLTTDELLHKYTAFAHKIAARWKRFHPSAEYDDLHAEVTLGFVEAAKRYDRTRGWAFGTYAAWYALKNVQQFVGNAAARGFHVPGLKGSHKTPYLAVGSLYECNARDGEEYAVAVPQPEADGLRCEGDWWAAVLRVLHRRDRLIVLLWAHGAGLDEIAARVGVTRERVRQRREKAFERLRTFRPDLYDATLGRGA